MANYINTLATQKIYDRIVGNARERLVFLQPFLKLHPVLQESLANLDRSGLDVLFVYSLGRLDESEVEWLKARHYIRVRSCPSLHMRCCMNEREILVTSRGVYRVDSTHRYDMGFHVVRDEDPEIFKGMYDDVYRIVGDSREAELSVYRAKNLQNSADELVPDWVIADRMKMKLDAFYQLLIDEGYLIRNENKKLEITPKGEDVGGKAAFSKRYGPYFVWPLEVS